VRKKLNINTRAFIFWKKVRVDYKRQLFLNKNPPSPPSPPQIIRIPTI
jgi:hypothetical protein